MYNNVSYNFTYTWINCYNIKANDISYHNYKIYPYTNTSYDLAYTIESNGLTSIHI